MWYVIEMKDSLMDLNLEIDKVYHKYDSYAMVMISKNSYCQISYSC